MSVPHDVVEHGSLERGPRDAHGRQGGDVGQPLQQHQPQQQPQHEEVLVTSEVSLIGIERRGSLARRDVYNR